MRVENIGEFHKIERLHPQKLEQAFLEEMIKHFMPENAGFEFSGGIGEEQFSSFLGREYAIALAQRLNLDLGK